MYALKLIMAVIMSANSFFMPLIDYFRGVAEGIVQTVDASQSVRQSTVVYEAKTGTVISAEHEEDLFPIGHFAKLMTLLLVQEAAEAGDISYNDVVKVSGHANSMQGTQIWLDAGEEITVEELVKAITVGNANDACVALAETVADSEDEFVEKMNSKALALGMESTYFADCTGISDASVTTAIDVALLCAELSKHEQLYSYMTTWIDTVRSGKVQLVNLNRLVRTYKGAIGIKACYIEGAGNCLAAAASRDDMTLITVIIGSSDEDSRFDWAKEKMNMAFAAYEVYEPELSDGALQDISVIGGEKTFCKIDSTDKHSILIPSGSSGRVEIDYERVETVHAPITKGTIIGEASFTLNGEEIFSTELCAAENVDKLSYIEALRRLLLDLLKT